MAGQGYRTWTAGEQLTDTKMQQYLQDQSVMRFADSTARSSALAGVVSEGMVSYLDDLNKLQVYTGSDWAEITPDVQNASQGTAGIVFGLTQDFSTANSERNLSLGKGSGGTALTGSLIGNTSIGQGAAPSLTTGRVNTVVGNGAAISLTSGNSNIIIGASTVQGLTTGTNNVAVGLGAGFSIAGTASYNTFLGNETGINGYSTFTGSNLSLIGNGANPSSSSVSNEITLGNSSISTLRCQVTSITALSDERDKADIAPLEYGLDFVNQLNPVTWTWNTRDGAKVGELDFGFIAQHLAEVEDKHNAERLKLTLRENPEKLEATPGRLIPILVKAIQELSAKVEELENAIAAK